MGTSPCPGEDLEVVLRIAGLHQLLDVDHLDSFGGICGLSPDISPVITATLLASSLSPCDCDNTSSSVYVRKRIDLRHFDSPCDHTAFMRELTIVTTIWDSLPGRVRAVASAIASEKLARGQACGGKRFRQQRQVHIACWLTRYWRESSATSITYTSRTSSGLMMLSLYFSEEPPITMGAAVDGGLDGAVATELTAHSRRYRWREPHLPPTISARSNL